MKRLLVLLLVISIAFIPFSGAAFADQSFSKDASKLKGISYYDANGIFKMGSELIIKSMLINESNIEGVFGVGKDIVNFTADETRTFTREDKQFVDYSGKAKVNENEYNISIFRYEKSISGMVYDNSKKVILSFIISEEDLGFINDELTRVSKQINKTAPLITVSEEVHNDGTKSAYYNRTIYMFKDAFDIPYILSGGTVEGTLSYVKAVNDPSGMRYSFKDVYGCINAESGFDGFTIANEDEVYGIAWGSPNCPTANIQTWKINYDAYMTSPYYFCATVSYRMLVNNIPVLYYDTDEVLIN